MKLVVSAELVHNGREGSVKFEPTVLEEDSFACFGLLERTDLFALLAHK
jgi:hypothetical protein